METRFPVIGVVTHVHTDTRRKISEYNGPDFSIQQFEVMEKIPLGNHFHKEKNETFIILEGGGTFLSCPVNDDNEFDKTAVKTEEISAGAVIYVPAYLAHTFLLEPGSKMICYSSARYEEDNKDMTPAKLV